MGLLDDLAVVVAAYFIGAFPHLIILAKIKKIPPEGDLHIALWQKAGPGWGLAATGIDVLKGIGTVITVRGLGYDPGIIVLSGLAATCGQMWPVFKNFDGEKGNTTGFGAAVALAFWPALLALIPVLSAIFLKLIKALRLKNITPGQRFKTGAGASSALPIAVAVAFLTLPLLAWILGEPVEMIIGFLGLLFLIMIRRLTAGLSRDLQTNVSRWQIVRSRLLLDRGVSP